MSDQPHTFDRDGMARVIKATRWAESEFGSFEDDSLKNRTNTRRVYDFQISSLATGKGKYNLTLLTPPSVDLDGTSNLVLGDFGSAHTPASGRSYIGFVPGEVGLAAHFIPTGSVCQGIIHRVQSDGKIFVRLLASPPAMMPVRVTVDGGSAGSDSTTCSFTYTVTSLAGSQLGTAKTPLRHRFTDVEYNEPTDASYGQAFYDGTTLVLVEAFEEYPLDVDCEEAT